MQQIAAWLDSIGLGEYAQRFIENDIDIDILSELTDQDLEKMGMSLGHRQKLLRAIGRLDRGTLIAPQVSTEPVRQTGAERRHVTVMFVDLVGSTEPEDLRAVFASYRDCVTGLVDRFGGFVARYVGDGVLVYFGYPRAEEDDPERAVRSAPDWASARTNLRHSSTTVR